MARKSKAYCRRKCAQKPKKSRGGCVSACIQGGKVGGRKRRSRRRRRRR